MEAGGRTCRHCVLQHEWYRIHVGDGLLSRRHEGLGKQMKCCLCHSWSWRASGLSPRVLSEDAGASGYQWCMRGMKGHQIVSYISWRSIWWLWTKYQFIHWKGLVHKAPRCWSSANMLALSEVSGKLNSMFLVSQGVLGRQVHFTERINSLHLPIQG